MNTIGNENTIGNHAGRKREDSLRTWSLSTYPIFLRQLFQYNPKQTTLFLWFYLYGNLKSFGRMSMRAVPSGTDIHRNNLSIHKIEVKAVQDIGVEKRATVSNRKARLGLYGKRKGS